MSHLWGGVPTGASHLNICLELGVGAAPPRLLSCCHQRGLCLPKTPYFLTLIPAPDFL